MTMAINRVKIVSMNIDMMKIVIVSRDIEMKIVCQHISMMKIMIMMDG